MKFYLTILAIFASTMLHSPVRAAPGDGVYVVPHVFGVDGEGKPVMQAVVGAPQFPAVLSSIEAGFADSDIQENTLMAYGCNMTYELPKLRRALDLTAIAATGALLCRAVDRDTLTAEQEFGKDLDIVEGIQQQDPITDQSPAHLENQKLINGAADQVASTYIKEVGTADSKVLHNTMLTETIGVPLARLWGFKFWKDGATWYFSLNKIKIAPVTEYRTDKRSGLVHFPLGLVAP